MDQNEFSRQKAAAAERMRLMHERSRLSNTARSAQPNPVNAAGAHIQNINMQTEKKPPEPQKTEKNNNSAPNTPKNTMSITEKHRANTGFAGFELPELLKDSDTTLLLGLLLLLFSEKADHRLMLALLYILM